MEGAEQGKGIGNPPWKRQVNERGDLPWKGKRGEEILHGEERSGRREYSPWRGQGREGRESSIERRGQGGRDIPWREQGRGIGTIHGGDSVGGKRTLHGGGGGEVTLHGGGREEKGPSVEGTGQGGEGTINGRAGR